MTRPHVPDRVADPMRLDPATTSPSQSAGLEFVTHLTEAADGRHLLHLPRAQSDSRLRDEGHGRAIGEPCDIGDRSDVRALLGAHDDLLLFLTDRDSEPQSGVWRSQLQRLAERYVNAIAEVRDAGMAVEVAGGDTTRDGLRVFISGAAG